VINIDAIVAVLQTVRQLISAPWLKKAALSDMLALIKAWESEYQQTYRAIPEQSQKKFVSKRIASFVRSSNKLEQTSAPYSQGTYKSLVDYALAGEHASKGVHRWAQLLCGTQRVKTELPALTLPWHKHRHT